MSEKTIFAKIIAREIPADIVYETDSVLAFRDVAPKAPVHVLVIPKKELRDMSQASAEDKELMGELMLAAAEVARQESLESYRLVVNTGESAGQTVFHLHLHVIGGRDLNWPPG